MHSWRRSPACRRLGCTLDAVGVSEDQVSVIELDCPASARFRDVSVSDGDGVSEPTAEVIDDGAKALITTAGVHRYTLTWP